MNSANVESTEQLMIDMRGVTKVFPGVVANADVDFSVRPGEIHALLGENGAGKTTLMNVLYGLYAAEKGTIYMKGERIQLQSSADAIAHRIGMVHQHFMLIPTLTVVENVALCLKGQNHLRLDLEKIEQNVIELSRKYGLNVDPRAKVSQLSVGEQQRVEILKALYRGAEVLIMDEPTAVLTPTEVEELFLVLKDVTKHGNSIIFITHKLWEVMSVADRVTVLRDGEKVATVNTVDVTKEKLANMMVGREVFLTRHSVDITPGDPVLVMDKVSCKNDRKLGALKDFSLQVRAGEILGIAGVDGNGQKEIAEVIHGLRKVDGGTIRLHGMDITNQTPRKNLRSGLSHIPEDRHSRGVVLDFSIAENIALIEFDKKPYTVNGIYKLKNVRKRAEELQKDYDIRCVSVDAPIKNLSGGNQQKVVLAREISRGSDFMIASQPTRGLDIGASEFTYRLLFEEKEKLKAIMLISTDLDEILTVSDRALVIYEGEIMGEITPGETSIEEIGLLMAGTRQSEIGKEGGA